jgi:hypothetical protein
MLFYFSSVCAERKKKESVERALSVSHFLSVGRKSEREREREKRATFERESERERELWWSSH